MCMFPNPREVKDRMERENLERQREQEELRAKMEREKGELEKQLEVGNKGLEEQGRRCQSKEQRSEQFQQWQLNMDGARWSKAVWD